MSELRADIINKADFYPVWIPVSERLPGKSGDYLITYEYEGFTETQEASFYEKEQFFDVPKVFIVTAWMPLPEPYIP